MTISAEQTLSLERAVCCKRRLLPTTRILSVFFWSTGLSSLKNPTIYNESFPRADAKAVIDPEETRTPQAVLFEIATTRTNTVEHDKLDVLDLLFDAIAKDLPDNHKLAWLLQLGGDKEKFCSLLNTLEPDMVRHNCSFISTAERCSE